MIPEYLTIKQLGTYIGRSPDTLWRRHAKPDPPVTRNLTHPEPSPGKLLVHSRQQPRRRNDRGESGTRV